MQITPDILKKAWLFICSVISFIVGYFSKGYLQAVLLALGSAFLGAWLGIWYLEIRLTKKFLHLLTVIVGLFVAFSIGWYLGYHSPKVSLYPREDGLIANFTTGPGGTARNIFEEVFNVIVDSENNGESKCWYENICHEDGGGFLRIYYQLMPRDKGIPYVGVFTDFSHPPPKVFDVSHFSKISLKIRLGQPITESPISMFVVLATANIQKPGWYDYCEYQIPTHELQSFWVKTEVPLDKMFTPNWSPHKYKIDTKQAFRISIAIKCKLGEQQHGYIDVDDIMFEK